MVKQLDILSGIIKIPKDKKMLASAVNNSLNYGLKRRKGGDNGRYYETLAEYDFGGGF